MLRYCTFLSRPALFALAIGVPGLAEAQPSQSEIQGPARSRFEFWSGAQAFEGAWSVYSGVTAAPFTDLSHDGVRLRAVAGYGAYSYSGQRATPTLPIVQKFNGHVTFTDILGGYQWQLGTLTLKGFAGLTASDNRIEPYDIETRIIGTSVGAKMVIESWWNVTDQVWTSLDLAWASPYESYSARLRLGWRVWNGWSMGVQAGLAGNEEYDAAQIGPFLRYEWANGEFSLVAGLSSDNVWDRPWRDAAESSTPFASVNWLTRF
jgi:hypothetical protein